MTPDKLKELLRYIGHDYPVVVHGPQGCGKTRNGDAIRRLFRRKRVVEMADDPNWRKATDAVVLTSQDWPAGVSLNYVNYLDIQENVEALVAAAKES